MGPDAGAFADERVDDMVALLADDVEWLDHSTDASGLRGRIVGKAEVIAGPLADLERLMELHALPVGPTAANGDTAFNLFDLTYTVKANRGRYEGPVTSSRRPGWPKASSPGSSSSHPSPSRSTNVGGGATRMTVGHVEGEPMLEDLIRDNRLRLADLLEGLDMPQWGTPTLCREFTVRDVVGHLTFTWRTPIEELVGRMQRHGGDFDAASIELARELGDRPTSALVADLRDHADDVQHPPGTQLQDLATEALVHPLDIARPLGLPWDTDAAASRGVLDHLLREGGDHYRPGIDVSDLRGVATDLDWSAGTGDEVHGPVEALLLVLTGRPLGLADLEGNGATTIGDRLRTSSASA